MQCSSVLQLSLSQGPSEVPQHSPINVLKPSAVENPGTTSDCDFSQTLSGLHEAEDSEAGVSEPSVQQAVLVEDPCIGGRVGVRER